MTALATSLATLRKLQAAGVVAIRSDRLTRPDRQRLVQAGYLREVMKGWYTPVHPDLPPGERPGWYASYWGFCSGYLEDRFGSEWCLSPQTSISLHAGDWGVPRDLRVRSPKGGNKPMALPFETSLFDVRLDLPPVSDRQMLREQRVFNLPAALIACPPTAFSEGSDALRTVLGRMDDPSELLRRLVPEGRTIVAGRLAGALRSVGRADVADRLLRSMRQAGHLVHETDPFGRKSTDRLGSLWSTLREPILHAFPAPPPGAAGPGTYLERVDALYVNDAYHSLSLEGYQVSHALIEQVRPGHRSSGDSHPQNRNALAIRGYRQAFRRVMKSIQTILAGESPITVVQGDCEEWYANLLGPSIAAGLANRSHLDETLLTQLFSLLGRETDARVRAVLGHFLFIHTQPRLEGVGIMARFLMNALLAAGGYPWTLIPVEGAREYRSAIESASTADDIRPLAELLARCVKAAA